MIPILPSGDSSKRWYLHLSLSLLYLTPSSCAVKFPRKFLKVIHLNRPLRCQSCCFPCCLQEIEVIFFTSIDCDHCPLSSFWCLCAVITVKTRWVLPPDRWSGLWSRSGAVFIQGSQVRIFIISHQSWDVVIFILTIRFVIKDEAGSEILKIEGPLCPCSCCGDVDFNVRGFKTSLSGKNIQIYMFVPKSCSGRVCWIFR